MSLTQIPTYVSDLALLLSVTVARQTMTWSYKDLTIALFSVMAIKLLLLLFLEKALSVVEGNCVFQVRHAAVFKLGQSLHTAPKSAQRSVQTNLQCFQSVTKEDPTITDYNALYKSQHSSVVHVSCDLVYIYYIKCVGCLRHHMYTQREGEKQRENSL